LSAQKNIHRKTTQARFTRHRQTKLD